MLEKMYEKAWREALPAGWLEAMEAAGRLAAEHTGGPANPVCRLVGGELAAGEPCIAQWTEDSVWYNAVVQEVHEDGALVLFTDYGNSELAARGQMVRRAAELPGDAALDQHVVPEGKPEPGRERNNNGPGEQCAALPAWEEWTVRVVAVWQEGADIGVSVHMVGEAGPAEYEELQRALDRHYGGSQGDEEELTGGREGQLVAAVVRGRWERGQLVRHKDSGLLRLWLVDGGEEVLVPPFGLRPLRRQFGLLPGAAARALLVGPQGDRLRHPNKALAWLRGLAPEEQLRAQVRWPGGRLALSLLAEGPRAGEMVHLRLAEATQP
jgi:hypothetical protein